MAEEQAETPRVFLDRITILSKLDQRREACEVPEWGCYVWVGSWTAGTRWRILRDWQRGQSDGETRLDMITLVVALSVVDEYGKRMFSDEDIPGLQQKTATALQRIFDAAMRLNGMSEVAVAALGKGSGTTATDASPSDSPSPSALAPSTNSSHG
jgi:hypothetical protein